MSDQIQETFEVGSIVTLNGGGPPMTVLQIRSDRLVVVNWFAGDELHEGYFPAESIQLRNVIQMVRPSKVEPLSSVFHLWDGEKPTEDPSEDVIYTIAPSTVDKTGRDHG